MATLDSDVNLMLAFCSGDELSFVELLNRFEKPLLNFIYKFIGNRTEAEDLTQDVFVKVYQAKKYYYPKGALKSWLYTIAANMCLNYKRKKMPISFDEKIYAAQENPSPEETLEKNEKTQLIKNALAKLPKNQRLVLILAKFENRSYKEIADILDCSVSSVESLLFRARQNLKKMLAFRE
jgi:RNA polymerase sigma-70 factor (ECF subfamily)